MRLNILAFLFNPNLTLLETIFDTKTGKVIDRKRFYHTKYRKKKK